MPTPEEYIITTATKTVGEMLETLDNMKVQLEGVDFERIAEKAPESLTIIADGLAKLNKNLAMSLLVPIMANVLSKDEEEPA